MAIDFMVMQLSRYISGDYITPSMRLAWDSGVPYSIYSPEGQRSFPADVPFGGSEASTRRHAIIPMLSEDLAALPGSIPLNLWDELADIEPRFHRAANQDYEAFIAEASTPTRTLASLFRPARQSTHLSSTLFLPCDFATAFEMSSPFERRVSSVSAGLAEVNSRSWSSKTVHVADVFRNALADAMNLRIPMVVDF